MLRSIPMISAGFQAVSVENIGGGQGIFSFFKEAGPTAKVVLAILLFFSFVSWIIIFAKFVRLRVVSRQSEKFVEFFRKSRRFSEVNTVANQLSETPLSTLFKAGYAELDAQVKANRPDDPGATASGVTMSQRFLIRNISGIERALERAIGTTGSTSIVAVAPGISEALVNTAAGLAAAIPALIFYNYFMGKVRQQRAGMEDFALEFINLAERNFT